MKKVLLTLSFLTLNVSLLTVSAQIINTVVGNGSAGYSGDGGPATAADLDFTADVAFDASGNMYVADNGNNRIRKVNTNGIISTVAGNGSAGFSGDGGPATAADLNGPTGVVIDASGDIIIVDQTNNRVRLVNTSGTIKTIAGNGSPSWSGDGGPATAAQINSPDKATIDPSGNIYIADYSNNCIRKINTSGIISTFAGNTIAGFSGDGSQATLAQLTTPSGICLDNQGNMYIGDYGNNRVRKINASGIISTVVGTGTASSTGDGGPATAATVNKPSGVLTDNYGHLYVNEFSGHKIREVNSSGTISTFAGRGASNYTGDGGQATACTMTAPYGSRFDAAGNFYFADLNNNVIRKISGSPLAVNPVAESNLVIYPNPSNGVFTVSAEKLSGERVVEIYNMLGKKVYSQTFNTQNSTFSIDLSSQPNGIYLLRVQSTAGSIITKKIEIAR